KSRRRPRATLFPYTTLFRSSAWEGQGFTQAMKTPDDTLIFVASEKAREIRRDQTACMGCLSACEFSNWACNETHTTGKPPDPRSDRKSTRLNSSHVKISYAV